MNNFYEFYEKASKAFYNNDFSTALKCYYKILSEDLNNSVNYYNIALVYEVLCDFDFAICFYKKAISFDNNNIRAINNLARIYLGEVKDCDVAEKYLNYAIEHAPNDAEAYNLFGNLSMLKNDYNLAINYFKKSIRLDKIYFKNYYDIAVAYYAVDKIEDALSNVKKSIELNPNFEKSKELLQQIL